MNEDKLGVGYEIIASGSTGNCVIIEDVMVDCGVSYKKLKQHLYFVDYLLITHKHGDHINKKTFERIRKEFPNIVVISNSEVSNFLGGDVDYVIDPNECVEFETYTFNAFEGIHDVKVNGYYWVYTDSDNVEYNIIYCTDTHDFRYAPTDIEFDYLFLESNHDERKLNAIRKNSKKIYGYDAYGNGLRHASTQVCKAYYYMRRRDRESELIELHKSERFY